MAGACHPVGLGCVAGEAGKGNDSNSIIVLLTRLYLSSSVSPGEEEDAAVKEYGQPSSLSL